MNGEGNMTLRHLDDGRPIEFVDADWAADTDDEPAGTVPIRVTYYLDGELEQATVRLTSQQVEEAFGRRE